MIGRTKLAVAACLCLFVASPIVAYQSGKRVGYIESNTQCRRIVGEYDKQYDEMIKYQKQLNFIIDQLLKAMD
jgi:hypothetical protein